MFEKVRSALGVTTSALTALSAAVGIFAWMNITPEMVGQAAYDTIGHGCRSSCSRSGPSSAPE
ncbi:Uncharacterised protein [Collinsella intestinalis]|nr:Uncharacterised protein [Collinsella intestinalis]